MYGEFTYTFGFKTKAGFRWRCINTSACKAYIMVSVDGKLLKTFGHHVHGPPRYLIKNDGSYIKLKTPASERQTVLRSI